MKTDSCFPAELRRDTQLIAVGGFALRRHRAVLNLGGPGLLPPGPLLSVSSSLPALSPLSRNAETGVLNWWGVSCFGPVDEMG